MGAARRRKDYFGGQTDPFYHGSEIDFNTFVGTEHTKDKKHSDWRTTAASLARVVSKRAATEEDLADLEEVVDIAKWREGVADDARTTRFACEQELGGVTDSGWALYELLRKNHSKHVDSDRVKERKGRTLSCVPALPRDRSSPA